MLRCIYLVVGASGTGKTTIVNRLVEQYGLRAVCSYTTRPPRYQGEQGHIFVSDAEFDKLNNIVAFTEYDGYRYGAKAEQIDSSDIYVIDPDGITYFCQNYIGEKEIRIIFICATEEERKKRMLRRGDSEKVVESRIELDKKVFYNMKDRFSLGVYNDSLERAIEVIVDYIKNYDRKPVAQAPCFSYGVSGAVVGFH